MLFVDRSTSPDIVALSAGRNGVPLNDFISSVPLMWKVEAASDVVAAETISVWAPLLPLLGRMAHAPKATTDRIRDAVPEITLRTVGLLKFRKPS
jgi:hypothetical protein